MRSIRSAALLALCLGVPACSSSSAHPFTFEPDDTGADDAGTDAAKDSTVADSGSDATTSDANQDTATATDAPSDGVASDSAKADGTTDAADAAAPPKCAKAYSDIPTTTVSYPHAATGDRLAAITWDELTMAWLTTDAGGAVTIHYADRAGRDDAFVTTWTVPSSLGPFPNESVALSADGLTMIVASADHKSLTQVTRAARGTQFDPASATGAPFVHLVGDPVGATSFKLVGDVVLSKDGQWLFYTDLAQTSGTTLQMAPRLADGTWDGPTPIIASRLAMVASYRRRPSGISSDKLTLFYLDETSNTSMVAFRVPGTTLFDQFYAYAPTGTWAMPTDACDRVYLTAEIPPDKSDGGFDAETPLVTGIVHAP